MSRVKQPWHRGTHQRRAKQITEAAYANPLHRCWRCALTLTEVQARYPKRRVHWTAGHIVDAQIDGQLAAECSPCNYGHGARLRNAKAKRRTSRTW